MNKNTQQTIANRTIAPHPKRVILPILHFSDVSTLSPGSPSSASSFSPPEREHRHHRHRHRQEQQLQNQPNGQVLDQQQPNNGASANPPIISTNGIADVNTCPNAAHFASAVARQRERFSTPIPDSRQNPSGKESGGALNGGRVTTSRNGRSHRQNLAFEPDVLPEFDFSLGPEDSEDSDDFDIDGVVQFNGARERERMLEPLLLFGGGALSPSARVLSFHLCIF